MVSTLNICRATTDVAYCLPLSTIDPDNGGPKLAPSILARDAIADNNGWQATMTCTQLMVDATICTSGQLGTPVSVSKAQFADMMIRRYVLEQIKAYRAKQEQVNAQTIVDTEAAPDIGN